MSNDRILDRRFSVAPCNVAGADELIAEKTRVRSAEMVGAERHFEPLREGRPQTLETTSLHLDVLRDLRRIHSHLCSVAYRVLETAGAMPALDVAETDPIAAGLPEARPRA